MIWRGIQRSLSKKKAIAGREDNSVAAESAKVDPERIESFSRALQDRANPCRLQVVRRW